MIRHVVLATACLLTAIGTADHAQAATETVLYAFTGGSDGASPYAGLVADAYGNFYGTTVGGGAWNYGVVFRLTPAGAETVLHSFSGGTDGAYPYAGLAIDANYNLYGATAYGGSSAKGVTFRLRPSPFYRGGWIETVFHAFTGGTDGAFPYAGLTRDSSGNLYGTALQGGTVGAGTVFKIAPTGAQTVLYSFQAKSDGIFPSANLAIGANGTLYGTTQEGGTYNGGTIYELVPPPQGQTAWSESVLHSLQPSDGVTPDAGLAIDASDNLYGTASDGGSAMCGTVFELSPPVILPFAAHSRQLASRSSPTPNYNIYAWNLTVLHNFNGTDARVPLAGVVTDANGNLYGTTTYGGPFDSGAVYKIAPGGTETVLYSFTGGADGGYPRAGLILDSSGNLYGTTSEGGPSGTGVVFKIQP